MNGFSARLAIAALLVAAIAPAQAAAASKQSLIKQEVACMKSYAADPANNFTNYAPAIGAPEVVDAVHSGLQPCATFAGGAKISNNKFQVAQYLSPTVYPGQIQMIIQGGPNAAFLIGGSPGTPIAAYTAGPYVARFNPATGAQIWRTSLPIALGQWIAAPSGAVVKGGWVVVVVGPTIYKLNPTTGKIVASAEQPILDGEAIDANFDGFAIAPDSTGTILLKSQNRSTGCTIQGNQAMSMCTTDYGPQPDTTVVAVSSVTLANITAIKLSQPVAARPTLVANGGNTDMYLAGATRGVRVTWNPKTKTLNEDTSWQPPYLLAGQTTGDAPPVLGKWVIFNNNASPPVKSPGVPVCAVAAKISDAANIHRICPWGKTIPAGKSSNAPASFSTDPQKSLIFMQDMLMGGVFAVHLDQSSGKMKVKWSRPDWRTSDYFTASGPSNNRVLSSQYLSSNFPSQVQTGTWTESVLWVNEATGKTVAQSATNGPTDLAWMVQPAYAGRWYTMSLRGTINIYVPQKCSTRVSRPVSPQSITKCPPIKPGVTG